MRAETAAGYFGALCICRILSEIASANLILVLRFTDYWCSAVSIIDYFNDSSVNQSRQQHSTSSVQ